MHFQHWLSARLGKPPTLARPVLLLCRSDATAHSARIWAAQQRGFVGLEIGTLRALAHQLEGPSLQEPASEIPLPDNERTNAIRSRPGLLDLARQHARSWRLAHAADGDITAPAWLEELGSSGWADDTKLERHLLELARRHGPRLTPSIRFHRVVTLGFEGHLDPWERAMLEALGAETHPISDRADPQHAFEVPDPAAEARLAVELTQDANTLILVHHHATAARVHRALARNGISSALRRTSRLDRHTLAQVIRRCVPWFSGASDPAIRATDLFEVLRHPMVGDQLPEPARIWLEEQLGPEQSMGLHPRGLARAIRRARHLHAPLSAWLTEVEALSKRTDDERLRTDALRLTARLRVLSATLRGEHFQDAFPVEAPEEDPGWNDFDALIHSLQADEELAPEDEIPQPGTLGCLRRFLLACRVRTRDDAAAFQILGALRRGVHLPATRTDVLRLLTGSADRDELSPGVQILSYDDYDGRPCEQLILLDVHDQGIAARPKPDPLLSQIALAGLGLLDGRGRVTRELDQLRLACANAAQSTAILARHDTMGRALVPPVQLTLEIEAYTGGAYGLEIALPERGERDALQAIESEVPPEHQGQAQHLAVQASAEWVRHGRGATTPPKIDRASGAPTLTHRLVSEPMPAPWLGPWLGDARGVPEAQLDDAVQSASGFFQPLTHCLYQTFVKRRLYIDEPDEVGDELDAREIGHAVHDALEQVATAGAWSTDARDLSGVRASLTEALEHATHASFAKKREDFGALSPARKAAAMGLEARWARHWELYAERRVRAASLDRANLGSARSLIYQHYLVDAATDRLLESGRIEGREDVPRHKVRYWILNTSESIVDHGNSPRVLGGLPPSWSPTLEGFLKHPAFEKVLWLRDTAIRLTMADRAPIRSSAAEVPFGDLGPPADLGLRQQTEPFDLGPISLRLGDEVVRVRGRIDRVDLVEQSAGLLARIVDYKTGRTAPSEAQGLRKLLRLTEPQLVIYALVLRQALADGTVPSSIEGATLATVGWDHPRAVKDEKQLLDARDGYPLDDATLNLLARAIGRLVERGRSGEWTLHPNPDTCPQLSNWGHDRCPYVGACRFKDHA